MMAEVQRRIVLLSGLSGAGKTTATKSLEDVGFRTIDNVPHELLPALVEKIAEEPQRFARVCLVIDSRDGDPRPTVEAVRGASAARGIESRLIFLDSRDDVLMRRYSETRHRHPLGGEDGASRSVAQSIEAERRLLAETREIADVQIDTSDMSGRELRDRLVTEAIGGEDRIAIRVISFGFKHGLPLEADLVFDVRAAANPHWVPTLRPLDGRDAAIRDFVLADTVGAGLNAAIAAYLTATIDGYLSDGRTRLTIAIGCTGGRHRSVVIAESIAQGLQERLTTRSDATSDAENSIMVEHRDLGRV